jgi:TetR/AcrR family transcriptional regulator, cholesterol catabolism regulator
VSRPKKYKRKTEIYKTVATLIARNGYERTSIRDITRELGMSTSSLYYYFKSKEELLFDLINDAMDRSLATIEDICASNNSSVEKLNEVIRFYTLFYASNKERLYLMVHDVGSLHHSFQQTLIQKARRHAELLKSILKNLKEEGRLKDFDPTVAAYSFYGMIHWLFKWYEPRGPVSPEKLAETFLEIFTSGVLSPQ